MTIMLPATAGQSQDAAPPDPDQNTSLDDLAAELHRRAKSSGVDPTARLDALARHAYSDRHDRPDEEHVQVDARRAEAYDAHQNAVYVAALSRAREEIAERHAKLASALQAKLAQRLQALDPADLSPRDMAYWLEVSTRVERQARGEPERHEVTGKDGGPIEFAELPRKTARSGWLNWFARRPSRSTTRTTTGSSGA